MTPAAGPRTPRAGRTVVVGVTILLGTAIAVGLQVGVLADRGYANAAGSPGDLVVLAANTQADASASDLANLLRSTGADVVVLPETTREVADDVAARVAASGSPMQVLARRTGASPITSTALLVAARLGEYRIDVVDRSRAATFIPIDGDGPVLVAGDFNATLDRSAFARRDPCADAAEAAGAAGLGTWPSPAPRGLAAPTDHVLVDGRTCRVRSFAVLDRLPGSDHRPVVAHLSAR